MKVSIIIVNYNTFALTCQCVQSVYNQNYEFNFEIIIVDNASVECDSLLFKNKFPDIKLIISAENGGFARGNNQGIYVATGEYILLLNSDTIMHERCLEYCIQNMDLSSAKNTAIMGCKLQYGDGRLQISSYPFKIGLKESLLDNPFFYAIARFFNTARHRDNSYIKGLHLVRHKTCAVMGAFMFCRSKAISKVGVLDSDFFMYYEELDWCYRFIKFGYDIEYVPAVAITHLHGSSSSSKHLPSESGKPKIPSQTALSKMLLLYKSNGRIGLVLYNIISLFNLITYIMIAPFRSVKWKENMKIYKNEYVICKKFKNVMLKDYSRRVSSAAEPFKSSNYTA